MDNYDAINYKKQVLISTHTITVELSGVSELIACNKLTAAINLIVKGLRVMPYGTGMSICVEC